jgi:hypothetical protein
MRFLLFPEEERSLIRHLYHELGLRFLATDGGATPSIDPTTRITDDFPTLLSRTEREFYFWCSEIGPIRRLGDAPAPQDAKEAVCLHVNREANPEAWEQLIDVSRTPVISWRRPVWYRPDRTCLVAGRLRSMTAKLKHYPFELRRLYQRIDRWLKKPATKINPFRHCTIPPVLEPANLNVFWVAAWPQGKAWVDRGGELWPWDG